jgi:hypothetical protein
VNAPGGLTYAFPRPPGDSAGQPWFLPECGITKDAYDPSKDPEGKAGAAQTTRGASKGARR